VFDYISFPIFTTTILNIFPWRNLIKHKQKLSDPSVAVCGVYRVIPLATIDYAYIKLILIQKPLSTTSTMRVCCHKSNEASKLGFEKW